MENTRITILVLLLSLPSCSYLTDFLLKQDTGVSVDAQIGDTENKVQTGVGSLGLDKENTITVEDSEQVQVNNTDDKYHITTEGSTTVNVYETNYWLYALFGIFLVGKPALAKFWKYRENKKQLHPHEYVTYTSIRRDSISNRDTKT